MTSENRTREDEAADRDAAPGARGWRGIVVMVLLVMAVLVSVLAVLFTIGRDVRSLRRELADVAAPASARLSELQRVLALEMAVQRGVDGTDAALTQYRALLQEERAHFEQLRPLTSAIGAGAAGEFEQLHTHVARWHRDVAAGAGTDTGGTELSLERGEYAAALAAAARLDDSISARTATLRAQIGEGERLESWLIVFLVLLAALAIAVLFRFAGRLHELVLSERRLALLAERRQAQVAQVSQDKDMFIRGVTHDLKNPIGVIGAYGELLEMGIHGPLNAEQARVVGRMRGAADQTLRIIEGLLQLSRSDAASLDLRLHDVELSNLVAAVVEDYRAAARHADVAIEVDDSHGHARVHTDGARVREILGNLLANAVRHTPAGGRIEVAVDRPREVPEQSFAIRVSDSGPGVPEDLRDDIFREFVRGRGSNGSGIGLAISRRIARALGGDLVLAHSSPKGARFELLLPARHPESNGGRS